MAKKSYASAGLPIIGHGVGAIIQNARPERKPTERQAMRDHAKRSMSRATEDWVDGRITTDEHKAVHARGQHVLAGKPPREFKGKSGERKPKYL